MTTNEITAKVKRLKELQALIDEANSEAETIKDELKAHMRASKAEKLTVDVYKIRYITVKSSRFDSAAFKKTHSELYSQYIRATETQRFSIA